MSATALGRSAHPATQHHAACEAEPIATPGCIQPHGMLLATGRRDRVIRACSDNAEAFVGRSARDLVGRPLTELLSDRQLQRLDQRLATAEPGQRAVEVLHEPVGGGEGPVHLLAHLTAEELICELEPGADTSIDALETMRTALSSLDDEGADRYPARLAHIVGELTGFPRVVFFRFHDDGTGSVIAEARPDAWPAFLGKRFPASDVPLQARRLFARTGLRFTPDLAYEPVPILGDATLDLSFALLRHVSGSCTTYKRNMGHRSSFAVAIPSGPDELWGLISCFDDEVRHVPFGVRAACDVLARVAAAQLRDRAATRTARMRLAIAQQTTRAFAAVRAGHGLSRLAEQVDVLAGLATADGFVLSLGTDEHLRGDVPTPDDRRALGRWLTARPSDRLISIDIRGEPDPPEEVSADCPPGLLAVRLDVGGETALLQWHRRDLTRTVTWAGDPYAEPVEGPDGRLTPRGSFALWQETVRGTSEGWDEDASLVADALGEAAAALTSEGPAGRDDETERFVSHVAHDLKSPLRNINFEATFFREAYAESLDAEALRSLDRIGTLASQAGALVDSLMALARDPGSLRIASVDVPALLHEAVASVGPQLRAVGAEVEIVCDVPTIACDRILVLDVLVNLISNAVKYLDRPAGEGRIRVSASAGHPAVVSVTDNGPGIAEADLGRIFEPFLRLRGAPDGPPGTGLGLAVVRKLVEAHGGQVSVRSQPGSGSTFSFTLEPR